MGEPTWTVVVPVKRLGSAKSRLRGALPGVPHEELALALARDTVHAVLDCPEVARVTVVTDDERVARSARSASARVVPDPGTGLNAAFAAGADGGWVAALTADLPALRPVELGAALRAALLRPARRFVADAPGSGTVLLTAPPGVPLDPRFGVGSATAHAASGALALTGDWPTLRRDVDTAADLAVATVLGLGRYTTALVGAWPVGGHRRHRRGPDPVYGAGMQGTVATYDQQTRSGTLLLDDGTELTFPAAAFDVSGFRLLRLGQRVTIDRDGSGDVIRVTLPGLS